jgi:hypothetical protein
MIGMVLIAMLCRLAWERARLSAPETLQVTAKRLEG